MALSSALWTASGAVKQWILQATQDGQAVLLDIREQDCVGPAGNGSLCEKIIPAG